MSTSKRTPGKGLVEGTPAPAPPDPVAVAKRVAGAAYDILSAEREAGDSSDPDSLAGVLAGVLAAAEDAAGPHKPSIATDWTVALTPIPNASLHDSFPAVESPCPTFTPAGASLGKHKLTGTKMRKVLHLKKPIVMQGHDVGPIIHVVLAPDPAGATALSILRTAFASRKCMFGAGRIALEKGGVLGSCTLTNWPPTPMLYCFDPVPLPMACTPQSHLNTISFSMTWKDYLLGATLIAIDMVVSFAFSAFSSAVFGGGPVSDNLKGTEAAKAATMKAVQEALGGAYLERGQSTVTQCLETLPIALLAEPGHEHEVTWLDLHVWSFSTTYERGEGGEMREVVRDKDGSAPAPNDPDADDPLARYSYNPATWGDVL